MKYPYPTVETECLTEGCYYVKHLCALVELRISRQEDNNHKFTMLFTHPEIERFRKAYKRDEFITLFDLPKLFEKIETVLDFSKIKAERKRLTERGYLYA